jgi:hypothetical protein
MVGPGQVTCSSQAVRARGAAGEQSAHGAESPCVHCLVAAPDGRRSRDNQCMPPPPGEDAVLHREERAGGADLAAPSSMVDPSDDVGEGGTTTAKPSSSSSSSCSSSSSSRRQLAQHDRRNRGGARRALQVVCWTAIDRRRSVSTVQGRGADRDQGGGGTRGRGCTGVCVFRGHGRLARVQKRGREGAAARSHQGRSGGVKAVCSAQAPVRGVCAHLATTLSPGAQDEIDARTSIARNDRQRRSSRLTGAAKMEILRAEATSKLPPQPGNRGSRPPTAHRFRACWQS